MSTKLAWGTANTVSVYTLRPDDLESVGSPTTFWAQVYSDRPLLSAVIANTGGILGSPITTGTYDTVTGGYSISIPAVTDPNPSDEQSEEMYYLGYTWDGLPGIIPLEFEKALTLLSRLNISQADLEAVDRNVTQLFGSGSANLAELGQMAEFRMREYFKAKHVDWRRIKNLGDLRYPAVFYALSIAYTAEIQVAGDGPSEKARLYKQEAEVGLSNFVVEISEKYSDNADEGTLGNSSIRMFG